jgi:hypothetical protein
MSKIIWTRHAESRQKEWEQKRGITRFLIEEVITNPGQTVPGDLNALVAQTKFGGGLIRVPFLQEQDELKILTLYWTSRVEKYWKEIE